uniref:Uncharacterized protein n=1 Tax=Echinococcus granulosus TaxID=6210 RepID=U6JGI7_ECHGR|nr:hypothetical protein EgrG_001098200 [Echinococcus granulosus]CDS23227.1 hypothetical protein EgrG_001098600 [Echinococcus granulosus]
MSHVAAFSHAAHTSSTLNGAADEGFRPHQHVGNRTASTQIAAVKTTSRIRRCQKTMLSSSLRLTRHMPSQHFVRYFFSNFTAQLTIRSNGLPFRRHTNAACVKPVVPPAPHPPPYILVIWQSVAQFSGSAPPTVSLKDNQFGVIDYATQTDVISNGSSNCCSTPPNRKPLLDEVLIRRDGKALTAHLSL